MRLRKISITREKNLDFFILSASIIAIFLGIGMILFCLFFFFEKDPSTGNIINEAPITQLSPYILFISLIILGFAGIRYFRKEVEI